LDLRANELIHSLWKDGVHPGDDAAREQLARRTNEVEAVRLAFSQLLLQVPEEHPVAQTYEAAIRAVDNYREWTAGYTERLDYLPNRPKLTEARHELLRAEFEFLARGRETLKAASS